MSDVVAELKPLLEQLIDLVKGHDARLAKVEAEQEEIRHHLNRLERLIDVAEIRGRVEEQGKLLKVVLAPH